MADEPLDHPLVVPRLKQLLKWHADLDRATDPAWILPYGLAIGFGVGIASGLLGFLLYWAVLGDSEFHTWLFAVSIGGPLGVVSAVWMTWRRWRLLRGIAVEGVRNKIAQLVQEFPELVRSIGGAQKLTELKVVRSLLHDAEARAQIDGGSRSK